MLRENIYDLVSFIWVVKEGNFTKAAARLGISQSALSHAMRKLEERLGMQLLRRSTRSVSTTEIGQYIFDSFTPLLEKMEGELLLLTKAQETPSGTIRLTVPEYAARVLVWPKVHDLLSKYPDIRVEINIDYSLTDIVAERYDAGIRLGEQVEKDMVAIRISPEIRMAAVASPDYFKENPIPLKPQDLLNHKCINLRLSTSGRVYSWEFEENGHEIRVKVEGQLTFNTVDQILHAVEAGFGIAYITENEVIERIKTGKLIRVLADFSPPFPGYYLYYPSRRQHTLAFELLIEALRYRR